MDEREGVEGGWRSEEQVRVWGQRRRGVDKWGQGDP